MYVVYYGIGDSFAGSLAASLHLKTITYGKAFHRQLASAIPDLLALEEKAFGRLLFIGNDEFNNQIFLLNTGHAETIVLPALKSVFDILQVSRDRLLLVDTTETKSLIFLFGRFFYLRKIKRLGVCLMLLGIKRFSRKICDIVSAAKKKARA